MGEIAVPWNDFCCGGTWVVVNIVYHDSHEGFTSHLGRADYLLLVVEAVGTVPQLYGEGQDPVMS